MRIGTAKRAGLLPAIFLGVMGSPSTAFAQTASIATGGDANAQAVELGTITVEGQAQPGYAASSTSVATKTDTPLINIPQSVNVITKEVIKDQNPQNLTDVTRYVPGVAVHQGEGNRDELVIRGVDSSANFFVNGFRDDVQFFRDLYNVQSVEILKGPSALTFGRGSGGGLLNRTLKEADGNRVYEATAQTGSWSDRRVTLDAGQAVNDKFAARLNMMYEGGGLWRDHNQLERYGINPTFTYKPDERTKVKFSYEYFRDWRTADRGNPSQATSATGSTAINPGRPFAPGGDLSAFYGSPDQNRAIATVQTFMNSVEHDFGGGFAGKNAVLYARYLKFYQNIYPGGGALAGAVNPAVTSFNRAAYQHYTDRDNLINQTDFVWKGFTGPVGHTLAFGSEFGKQTGIDLRNTGVFPNGATTLADNPYAPTYFGMVNFVHSPPGSTDSNSLYRLFTESAYLRDTLEVTRWLQFIAGARFDRFDITGLDGNTGISRSRVDDKLSPAGAAIFKLMENLSFYYAYSKSYLPASGDQFSSLSATTVLLAPQQFENNEVGMKWNITPQLLYTWAVYQLDRTNVPVTDPNNPALPALSGANQVRGFETNLVGNIGRDWQSTLGYAYTDARVTANTGTSGTPIQKGDRVQLVPYHQASWWNKYQFTPVWSAAIGIIYFSDSFASSDDTVVLPSFVRVDAGIYANINETWRAQLNVENIFNRRYWASADGN
ncbi:MAG: TonB-dependent siderophore receptor, partial [Pseudolabrys sp.]|nr:TonB-dependent siderophore receptor [Pseudolabrys sp.]